MEGDSFSSDDMEGVSRTFWAVELVPGKEYTTIAEYDLRITQAVLPASASDKTRSVISIKFEEEEEEKEKEKSFAVASLKLDTHDSQALDLLVDQGQAFTLTLSGKNPVHLSGYYVPDNGDEGDDEGLYDDSDIDSDELGSEEEGDLSELDEEEQAKANAVLAQLKRKQDKQNGGEAKKAKVEAAPKQEKQQQPKQEKKPQQQQEKKPQQQQQKAQPKVFPNGLQIITTKEGTGAVASKGRKVSVKYVGKLTKNGKVFDASNKPFVFSLGAREVITGWDLGVAGMKVGEKRTLIIPPELGYGKEGAGREIPPNSSLTFDVELVNVK